MGGEYIYFVIKYKSSLEFKRKLHKIKCLAKKMDYDPMSILMTKK